MSKQQVVEARITFVTAGGARVEAPRLEANYEIDRELIARLIVDMEMADRLVVAQPKEGGR
jgi:hypothetical protein